MISLWQPNKDLATDIFTLEKKGKLQRISIVKIDGQKSSGRDRNLLFLASSDEVAIAIALIDQYEKLYKHYDNQKSSFANILILVSAAISATPFPFRSNAIFLGIAMSAAGVSIMIMSWIGLRFLSHLRRRMKKMQKRSQFLQRKLLGIKPYADYDFPTLIKEADEEAEKKVQMKSPVLEELSDRRGFLWEVIPRITAVYGATYFLVGLVALFCPSVFQWVE